MKKLIILCILMLFSFFTNTQINAQIGNFADVNGVKIYYEIHGKGEPLVLLHGFTLSHEMWDQYIEDLSKNHKLIIPDLRGHGHSTNPTNVFTHKEAAKDIYALLDLLNIEQFNGMGFSTGAMTLTHMATMDTSRIRSMVLIASTTFFPESCREIMQLTSYDELSERSLDYYNKIHHRGETQIRELLTQFRNMADSFDDMNFTSPYLSTIRASTLIIHGDRDRYFDVDIPINSYISIPNSYLWIVPNYGHYYIGKKSMWADAFLKIVNQLFSGEWD